MSNLTRHPDNPIIHPVSSLEWQAMGTFNPGAIFENGKIHLLFRAQAKNGTSVFGYASTTDGIHIDEKLDSPVYTPSEDFEKSLDASHHSGCEDPRLTKIDEKIYMAYTAYDGKNPPRVALTSILTSNFLSKNWQWEKPILISPPGVDDKNACIVKMDDGKYMAFHRLNDGIWLEILESIAFGENQFLSGMILAQPRHDMWDNVKIGVASPPLKTEKGWLLFYHAVSEPDFSYKVGAMLLDTNDPTHILARSHEPLLSPQAEYETHGQVPNVVFPCGAVIKDGNVYVYYGGADTVVGVATAPLTDILSGLTPQ